MTITLALFIISTLIISALLLSKHRELTAGKAFVRLGSISTDRSLVSAAHKTVYVTKHITLISTRIFIRKAIVMAEMFFMRMFTRASKRFVSVGYILTGKHVSKNRGSASFFLKNIEEHKKALSNR